MKLIAQDELPATLREYVPDLHACVRNGLDEFVAEHKVCRVDYTRRTEASIIHDYMVKHARSQFSSSCVLRQNLFLIKLGQDYLVKLKRLDQHHHVSRIPTNLSLQFEGQDQMPLFDDLDRIHLYLGYQFDPIEVSKSRIWITRPEGPFLVRFAAELTDDHLVQVLPVHKTQPRRITPKVDSAAKAVSNDA